MARIWRFVVMVTLLVLPVAIVFSGGVVQSAPDAVEIVCQIDSISSSPTSGEVTIPVIVENFSDSIAGVQLWINISNTELVKFAIDAIVDTTYFAKIDTSGTLLSGFESVQARIRDGANSGVLSLAAIHDNGAPPIFPPIAPQSGVIPLVKLVVEVQPNLGDSLCVDSLDLDINLIINKFQTIFSNPDNFIIGYTCDPPTIDTIFSNCAEFQDTVCINWFDTTYVPMQNCDYDSTKISYVDGKVAWTCGMCGDADGNGQWSIGDAVYIINYIFGGGPPPNPLSGGDADGNGQISIGDAVYIINFIFGGGPPPGGC